MRLCLSVCITFVSSNLFNTFTSFILLLERLKRQSFTIRHRMIQKKDKRDIKMKRKNVNKKKDKRQNSLESTKNTKLQSKS